MNRSRPVLSDTGFVRLPQILVLIPISRSAWRAGVREGKFPKGIKLGSKITAWRAESIRALIEQPHGGPKRRSRPRKA
ncbi:AlpA family phage regulatory protein [Accumulibacter sp.]|uniref:helix-turn-helix transcriptional regulator n=1 Tax=Accumulibacter sp. TaxID=2053492 RepID=UPI002D13F288|nr:AlpA family phage regulatory protein [Accumulibacter sp.]HNC21772.1 AlpA family phage regulatory protein [Accumulibacter sp.]HNO89384.1 AlpA family phage regulatory protein [Rhodocyclaceae bacterium]